MTEHANPEPIIKWPFWGLPFGSTLRGYLIRKIVTWPNRAGVVVAFQASFWIAAIVTQILYDAIDHFHKLDEVRPHPAYATVLVPWLFFAFGRSKRREMRKIASEARKDFEPWRTRWRQVEAEYRAFETSLRSKNYIDPGAYALLPALPSLVWRIEEHSDQPITTAVIQVHNRSAVEAFMKLCLSLAACEIARMGGSRCVVGRSGDSGIVSLIQLDESFFVWGYFRFVEQGGGLIPQLQIGHSVYNHPFEDNQGVSYCGDKAKLPWPFLGFVKTALCGCIPYIGPLIAMGVRKPAFGINRATLLRNRLNPMAGDSADLATMLDERHEAGGQRWVIILPQGQTGIHRTKALIIEAVHRAFSESMRAAAMTN